ncbi:MAG TPA: isopentenyl transferase family protein, partial [Burkholderiaceae bacterium]|nr:isopentenyl transferase family protein [Burkholderiaceae bacterium]
MDKYSKPLTVAIMGPTASGKTAAALEIARHLPCEIISVDSALVYCGMDIGTAKPTAQERAAAPHHLIDILDPLDAYSAMQFRRDALQLVADIIGRGNLP